MHIEGADLALLLSLCGVLTAGWFVMKRVDRFLARNRAEKEIRKTEECVILSAYTDDDVLVRRIASFRDTAEHPVVILCEAEDQCIKRILDKAHDD